MLTRLFRKGRFHTLLVFLGSAHLLSVPKVSVAAEQTKTAVIVSAGDLASLENSMKQLEKQGIEAYQKLGFKVILIGGVERGGKPLTPQSLIETLGSLRGVQDLRVDFIG
ncbi:MAG: hypothetical protein JNJ49_06915, partial [Bdellovibrionaceae bacterium]|nr:hypothetical protein [Pseudobdellovibrionaceae bacterium]